MSRLLFAAARGARIEYFDNVDLAWVRSPRIVLHETKVSFRIHPDDLHLQYGPISTALRAYAETGKDALANIPYIQGYFKFTDQEEAAFCWDMTDSDRSLFLLILAEALADEGL